MIDKDNRDDALANSASDPEESTCDKASSSKIEKKYDASQEEEDFTPAILSDNGLTPLKRTRG